MAALGPADAASRPSRLHVALMGVAGCGKSTVGALLAADARLAAACGAAGADAAASFAFIDADSYHTPANKAKMAAGQPLNDDDRAPWLAAVGAALQASAQPVVLACSALKRTYRAALRGTAGPLDAIVFLLLEGPEPLLRGRLQQRAGHFAGANLLSSQLATLERSAGSDDIWAAISVDAPPAAIVGECLRQIGEHVAAHAAAAGRQLLPAR